MELGDIGSGCEDEDCGLASGFPEDCPNQECQWEEPMFGWVELACVTVVCVLLMIFGLLGNILTILVVWLRPHMRSSTYLYLSSMAVSDLLILLLLPLDLYKLWRPRPWPLGDLICKLTMFLSECCTFSTILHITFLSLERYLAVCWPITAKTLVTRRRTKALIGCLWLGAVISAAPVLVMVGVEEVGVEEGGMEGWGEDGGWTGGEGGQGVIMISGGGEGSGEVALMGGGSDGVKWGKELKVKKEGTNKKNEDEGGGDGGGGGEEEGVEGWRGGEVEADDKSECRCSDYAVSSGLLSAMMILSNLYFLVPLGILGVVYSLIGRTLWLRPQRSRRDQTHTVKMLGVIVLVFVLCWLPFHIGRTLFSLSLGSGLDGQDAYADTQLDGDTHSNTHSDTDSHLEQKPDEQVKINTHSHTEDTDTHLDVNTHSETDTHSETHAHTDQGDAPADTHTHNGTDTHTGKRSHSSVISHTSGQCIHARDTSTPTTHINTHTYTLINTHTQNDTRSTTHAESDSYMLYYLSQYFNLVSSVLFYLSAAVNPLLYNLMSSRYKHALRSLIHTHSQTHSHTHSHHLRPLTTQHSTTTL